MPSISVQYIGHCLAALNIW